jgi:hypothetical protein
MSEVQERQIAQALQAIANVLKKIEEHLAVIAANQAKPKPR